MPINFVVNNSFPRLRASAELEFMQRLKIWGEKSKIKIDFVNFSPELISHKPLFALSLHEVTPKLTELPTIIAMWNPPVGIKNVKAKIHNLQTFDGYIAASDEIGTFIRSLHNSVSIASNKVYADFRFFPTSLSGIAEATCYSSLMYLGVNWDGSRHNEILTQLASEKLIQIYGPSEAWHRQKDSYRGSIPFNGVSVIQRLASHGAALCLHSQAHIEADTPSMRLFEAASAGCLIFSDNIPFAVRTFGDSIFIIPENDQKKEFIREKLDFAKSNKRSAREMAMESKRIFDSSLSIDKLMPKLVEFGSSIAQAKAKVIRPPILFKASSRVDVIVRSWRDSKSSFVSTVSGQTYKNTRIIYLHEKDNIDPNSDTNSISYFDRVNVIVNSKLESEWLPQVSDAISSKYVTMWDPDCIWAACHIHDLVQSFLTGKGIDASYADCVSVVKDTQSVYSPNFYGDMNIDVLEDRRLIPQDVLCHKMETWRLERSGVCGIANWLMSKELFLSTITDYNRSSWRKCGSLASIACKSRTSRRTGNTTVFLTDVDADEVEPIRYW